MSSPQPSVAWQKHTPVLLLDAGMKVLCADCDMRSPQLGEELVSFLSPDDLRRHRACFRRDPHTDYRVEKMPQNRAVFVLASPGPFGCTVLYVTYRYTLRGCQAEGHLLRDIPAYLSFLYRREEGELRRESAKRLAHYRRAPYLPSDMMAEENGTFALRSFSFSREGDRKLSLCTWIPSLLCEIQKCGALPDADIRFSTDVREGYGCTAPQNLAFVLTLLLGVMDDLAESRTVLLSLHAYGADFEIRLLTESRFFADLWQESADIRVLGAAAPSKRFSLALAEYAIGYGAYRFRMRADAAHGTLSLMLYVPAAPDTPEFKVPALLRAQAAGEAIFRAMLALSPNPDEDQENDEDIRHAF